MKNFNDSFIYYKEENSSNKVISYPFIKIKKTAAKKGGRLNYSHICNSDKLKIIKNIKDFKQGFIKQNEILNETHELKEACIRFLKLIEFKNLCLKKHIIAVSVYSDFLAKNINLTIKERNQIKIGGLLHDIGKISFPDYIFYKSEKLNKIDLKEIEKHPFNGYSILKETLPEDCEDIAKIALYHHEKWDGTGYPNRLKGKEIPIGARIVSICDSFDSMTRKKYLGQKIKSIDETLTELKENNNGQWDPDLVKIFINIVSKDNYSLYKNFKLIFLKQYITKY